MFDLKRIENASTLGHLTPMRTLQFFQMPLVVELVDHGCDGYILNTKNLLFRNLPEEYLPDCKSYFDHAAAPDGLGGS
jgi:hypothetical protein